jgi:hypothetical protein
VNEGDSAELFYRNCLEVPEEYADPHHPWRGNQWEIVKFPNPPGAMSPDFFMIKRKDSNRCMATNLKAVMNPSNLRTPRKVELRNCDDANIDMFNAYKMKFIFHRGHIYMASGQTNCLAVDPETGGIVVKLCQEQLFAADDCGSGFVNPVDSAIRGFGNTGLSLDHDVCLQLASGSHGKDGSGSFVGSELLIDNCLKKGTDAQGEEKDLGITSENSNIANRFKFIFENGMIKSAKDTNLCITIVPGMVRQRAKLAVCDPATNQGQIFTNDLGRIRSGELCGQWNSWRAERFLTFGKCYANNFIKQAGDVEGGVPSTD